MRRVEFNDGEGIDPADFNVAAKLADRLLHRTLIYPQLVEGWGSQLVLARGSTFGLSGTGGRTITLADGVWSCQPEAIRSAKSCHAEGIESIAIGFGSADQKFLKAIASSDEASFFTSMGGLVETFSNIAQVLRDGAGAAAPASQRGSRFSFLGLARR